MFHGYRSAQSRAALSSTCTKCGKKFVVRKGLVEHLRSGSLDCRLALQSGSMHEHTDEQIDAA
eukprot:4116262-Prorocentrum_lima.AAC.1